MTMYKPIDKDKVLSLVREKGPIIPIHLRKDLDTDTVLIGAVLSQLIAENKVRVTTVKIGGSPLYYTPGTEDRLANFVKYLNEKDRRVAAMLQEKKVMKDSEQDPLVKVCLRSIKDYAKALEVTIKGKKEVYWKWYMLSTEEAQKMIEGEVKPVKAVETKPVEKPKEEKKAEVTKTEVKPEPVKEEPKVEKPAKTKKVKAPKKEIVKQEPVTTTQTVLAKPNLLLDREQDEFFNVVRKFFDKNEIAIIDYKIVKKSEIDFTIIVPTKLGAQEYFCKAKDRKKITESDLSGAYFQGQTTKLPTVFLSTGELNKKAKEMLVSQFKGMVVKSI